MYAMSQHQYVYAAPPPPPPRQFSGHGTSSAFSSSANPDEDWTQISDLAERRRIQNRIAQRNYRKKLKRRLEDLERRAGTSDGASSSGTEKTTTATASSTSSKDSSRSTKSKSSSKKQQSQQQPQQISAPMKPMPAGQFTPPMHPEDNLMFQHPYDDRERSHTPPMFGYPTYPPPEEMMMAPYPASGPPAYRPITTEAYPGEWTATTVPVTLPSMTHFHDQMSYGFVPGMEMGATAYDSNPHTPPLSHSFDHSTNCSDSGYEYPTTPLSMPGSPGMTHPQH